jgi:sialidase-1
MRQLFVAVFVVAWIGTGTVPAHGADADPVPVFVAGKGGYHTYRIPAVIRTPRGRLLAFCEGRRTGRGDSGNIDVLLKQSDDGGRTWGETQVVWDDGPNTCGNPCPVVDERTGRILLLLTHNLGDDHEAAIKASTSRGTRTVWICQSDDEGESWTKPREITHEVKDPNWGWYATGPGVGIQLRHGQHAGRLVIPCDHSDRASDGTRSDVASEYGAHVIFSDDGGATWQRGGTVAPRMNECQVVELVEPPGGLLLDMRSYRGQSCRAQATSVDGGLTWSEPHDVPVLIEPVCQASLIRHSWPDGEQPGLLLFSNPADPRRRVKMTVRVSDDDGQRWSAGRTIHAGPAAYSCLVALTDHTMGCLYERGEEHPYEAIVFQRLSNPRTW